METGGCINQPASRNQTAILAGFYKSTEGINFPPASSRSNTKGKVEGLEEPPCELKIPFKAETNQVAEGMEENRVSPTRSH